MTEILNFQDNLFQRKVESQILLQDYQNLGFDLFYIIVVNAGPRWKNQKNRELMLKNIKNSWSGELY
jgi:hypothetical protein